MTLLTLVWNRPTSKRPRIFKPPNQYQHSEHYFSENWVKTSILNKDVPQDNIQLDLGQQGRQVVQQKVPAGTKKNTWILDGTNQNSRILQTEEQGHNFVPWFYLQNWWPCQDQQLEWDGHLQQCCQHPQRFHSKMAILHSWISWQTSLPGWTLNPGSPFNLHFRKMTKSCISLILFGGGDQGIEM